MSKIRSVKLIVLYFSVPGVLLLIFWFLSLSLAPDLMWKDKVQHELDFAEARAWALSAVKFYSPTQDQLTFKRWLTNAPKPLVAHYKSLPSVIVNQYQDQGESFNCISLRYGGGFVSWGVTIGDTNLPPTLGRGKAIEQWAPGVNFWRN